MKIIIEKYKYIFCIIVLFVITIFRLGKIYTRTIFNDFNAYYDVSKTILHGVDPYKLENLSLRWVDPPIVFPGYVSFYIPFVLFDLDIAKYLYLSFNIILGFMLAFILFQRVITRDELHKFKNDKSTCFFVFAIFAFLNSTPFLTCLKHGQTSIILAFCLLLLLVRKSSNNIFSYFLMSTAAVLKYSIMPFYGIMLFCKQQFKLCIIGFVLFLFWAIIPIFFGHNLVMLYTQYISVLKSQISGGFNSFPVSGYNMIQLDCFKISSIGLFFKGVFVLIFFHLLIKNIKKQEIGLNFVFMTMCVTMIIVYHRVYDMAIIMPLLIMVAIVLWKDKKFTQTVIATAFILFFMLPESIVFTVANILGQAVGENDLFYLSSFMQWKTIFPLLSVILFLISLFSAYLCYYVEEKFYFAFVKKEKKLILE